MIDFAILDMMARGGSVALLLLWSWLLIRDHRQALAARIGVAMNLAIICHIIASIPGTFSSFDVVDALLDTGSSATIGLFWLFARAWFDDARRISWPIWALALLPVLLVAVLNFRQLSGDLKLSADCFAIVRAIWFALAIAGLWEAWRGRSGDLVESRRRIRLKLVATAGALCLLVNIVEIAVFGFGAAIEWRTVTEVGILLACGLLCAAMFSLRQTDMFASAEQPSGPKLVVEDPALAARLSAYVEHNRAWRDETLTIAKLATVLGEQEYRLRRLINGQLGHRNFSAYLNGFRLSEVKAALADPAQLDVSILTIALDAGFGSLGPFNRAFRDSEGMTPSEFRGKNGQTGALPDAI